MLGSFISACIFLYKTKTQIMNIVKMSWLSDFVTCSTCVNIWSARSVAQLLNIVGDKISKYAH